MNICVYDGLVPWRAWVAATGQPTHLGRISRLKTIGATVLTYVILVGVIVMLLPLIG